MNALTLPETLQINLYGRDLENKVCRPVTVEDAPFLPDFILKMIAFAMKNDGVGLAAPQVGVYIQLAITLHDEGKARALINPEIVSFRGRDMAEQEGCLSIQPQDQAQARVTRSEFITLETGTLEKPQARIRTEHGGLAARVIQHEVDHLNGVFFINRVSALQRGMVLKKYAKWRNTVGHEGYERGDL